MCRRPFLIILLAFVLSVAVRAPHLDRPLSAHHEYCTAVALIVLHNWYVDGFFTHHGGPAVSFTTAPDLYPPGVADGPSVHNGVMYYFSHPPLAYDLPYLLFVASGVAPNVVGLEVFNTVFHLLAAWCLFLVVRKVVGDDPTSLAPLLSALLYLFMPAPLWFHGNAYMSDMFVQNFWLMHLAVAMRVFTQQERITTKWSLLLALPLFLTVHTSWLGVFAGVVVTVLAVWKWMVQRDRQWLLVGALCLLAVALALGVTWWRYTRVVDARTLMAYYASRFEVRGSVGMPEGVGTHLRRLLINYRMSYLPVILLLAVLFVRRMMKGPGTSLVRRGALLVFLLLTGVPVIMDHMFLLQYADHDFAAFKAGPFLCGLAGMALALLPARWAWSTALFTCVLGVLYFFRLNPLPGRDGGRYAQERTMGSAIAAEALPQEAVFTLGFTPEPQVQWYAKRTLFRVDSLPQVHDHLTLAGVSGGVVFEQRDGVLTSTHVER